VRHLNVGNKNVGLLRQDGFQRLLAVARLRHNRDVAFNFE